MPDELYRVDIRGNLAGQFRENVIYVKAAGITAGDPFDTANSLVNAIDSNWKAPFLNCLPTDYILDAIVARRVGPLGGPYAILDYAPQDQAGTRGANAVSQQLCPCITLIPPMGVKSAGRIFMPAVGMTDVNLNVFVAGYVTVIGSLMTAMIGGFGFLGGTAELGIYSRKLNTSSHVQTWNLSPVIGYQRRRAKPIGS